MKTEERSRRAGFTLVEVMISLLLVMMLTLAIYESAIFVARAHVAIGNYTLMDSQARSLVEQFGRDVRQFTKLDSFADNSFSGEIPDPDGSGTETITYTYDSAAGTFSRSVNGGSAQVLLNHVISLNLAYFNLQNVQVSPGTTSTYVKQIQLNATTQRKVILTNTTNNIISAQETIRA